MSFIRQSTTMFLKVSLYIFSLLVICESSPFVDTVLSKCSSTDTECLTKLIKTVIVSIGDKGVPEHDMPPVDPLSLHNVKLSLLDVDITLLEGVVKGVKKCTINKFNVNLEAGIAKLDLTCDIVVKGKYKVYSANPLIKSLLGSNEIHGDGDGKVKIQKLNLKLELPFKVVKRGDDIYLEKNGNISFTFEVGNMMFAANNLCLGTTESSETIVKLLNENWKTLIEAFGKDIMKLAIGRVQELLTNFFSKIPSKYYFTDDLTSYLAN